MESPPLNHAARFLVHPRFLFGCVIIVSLIRFVNLGFPDLQAWDEGVYALRSASIVHFGDWLDQTSHVPGGLTITCHPPLTFWTSAVLYRVFGASEWATRCTSALFGAGSVRPYQRISLTATWHHSRQDTKIAKINSSIIELN